MPSLGLTLRLVGGRCSNHRARIVPDSVSPRRGGCFEEAAPKLFFCPCHRGTARLDQSVANGLRATEKQPLFIVDIERLDLITTLPGCRANSAATDQPAAGIEWQITPAFQRVSLESREPRQEPLSIRK